jgi:hypothetical protein
MAFAGNNKNALLIKEGVLKAGTYSTPEAIPTGVTDPFPIWGWVEDASVGYVKMGTQHWTFDRTFAMPRVSTPSQIIRVDITQSDFKIVGELFQYDPDTLSTVLSVALTDNNYDILPIGSDILPLEDIGLRLDTQLVDGRELSIAMFAAKLSGTAQGSRPSGTEHVTYTLEAIATPHPNFDDSLATAQARRCYGAIVFGPAV